MHTGLRRGDVTDLRWTDINFTEGFIRKTIGDAQGFLRPRLNEDGSAVLSALSSAMQMIALALDGTDGMDTNSDTSKSDRRSG